MAGERVLQPTLTTAGHPIGVHRVNSQPLFWIELKGHKGLELLLVALGFSLSLFGLATEERIKKGLVLLEQTYRYCQL